MKNSILVIEDDTYLRKFIKSSLLNDGYSCITANCGKDGMSALKNNFFDLVIMDLDLGDMNGQQILELLRKQHMEVPVIIISTFSSIDLKVDLFDKGCDDYITKPFYIEELLARVKRLLNKSNISTNQEIMVNEVIQLANMELDYLNLTISKNGEIVFLTKKLFDLLSYFIKNNNMIITKQQLLIRFWDDSDSGTNIENTLTVHIHKLRKLIEENPSKPKYLITKRGLGYIFTL